MRAERFWYFYDLSATIAAARRQKLLLPTSNLNSFSLCSLSLSLYSVVILVQTLLQRIAVCWRDCSAALRCFFDISSFRIRICQQVIRQQDCVYDEISKVARDQRSDIG